MKKLLCSILVFWCCSFVSAQDSYNPISENKYSIQKDSITVAVEGKSIVYGPIRTNLDDKLGTLQGIIVDMENREIYEGSVVMNQAKISVFADPEASYNILVEDQEVVQNPLNIFVSDGQTSRTIAKHGVDSFVMDGSFDSVDSVCTDSPKVVTIIYDAR